MNGFWQTTNSSYGSSDASILKPSNRNNLILTRYNTFNDGYSSNKINNNNFKTQSKMFPNSKLNKFNAKESYEPITNSLLNLKKSHKVVRFDESFDNFNNSFDKLQFSNDYNNNSSPNNHINTDYLTLRRTKTSMPDLVSNLYDCVNDGKNKFGHFANFPSTEEEKFKDPEENAEKLRLECEKTYDFTHSQIQTLKQTTDERISQRLYTIQQWKEQVAGEKDSMNSEIKDMNDFKEFVRDFLTETESPLTIARDCLEERKNRRTMVPRKTSENENDSITNLLNKEISIIKQIQDNTKNFLYEINTQQRQNSSVLQDLSKDEYNKVAVIDIDEHCRRLNIESSEIKSYSGIELNDTTRSSIDEWTRMTNTKILTSRQERASSEALRRLVKDYLISSTEAINSLWECTNNKLKEVDHLDGSDQNFLKNRLDKIDRDLDEMKRSKKKISECLDSNGESLKLAETRMFKRNFRPELEHCFDQTQESLHNEINNLKRNEVDLRNKQIRLESSIRSLLTTQKDLEVKLGESLGLASINNETCLNVRKKIPMSGKCAC